MEPHIRNHIGLYRIATFPALCFSAGIAFLFVEILPLRRESIPHFNAVVTVLEAILALQLILAWTRRHDRFSIPIIYLFSFLYCFRILYSQAQQTSAFWGLRAAEAHNPFLGFLWYGIGIVLLHPTAFSFFHHGCQQITAWEKWKKTLGLAGWLLALAVCFYFFFSQHITRDGADWILRTTKPVWHLYMREPLTIGLYRWIFLAANHITYVSSYQVISFLSIISGIWSLFWLHRLFQCMTPDFFSRFVGWLLTLASGGMMSLFFGHVEVYPIFLTGLVPALFYAVEYQHGNRSIMPAAVLFSIAFLLHLSAGWLLPAFFLLPFLNDRSDHRLRDFCIFGGTFTVVQILWWGGLLVFFYDSDWFRMLARLRETFFVGPDRAMFLPYWAWLDSFHLWGLFNEYLYLTVPGCMLTPIVLRAFLINRNRESLFWFLLFAGYFLYTFFWNPDRGFPEDWDLFSPLVPLLLLFQFHVLLLANVRRRNGSTIPETADRHHSTSLAYLYIAAFSALPFVFAQIWYHHSVPFIHQ
ncbi:MAG: hypothetical protein C4527_18430 [Candidatus Omnitrophota bacterium]|nr:MAG: hypothetical protein C4527_18430 [Candidatus Omnitrophota bacterium]